MGVGVGVGEGKPTEEEEERSGSPLGPGGPFACSQCRGQYPTRDQLDRHETLHSPSTQVDNLKYVSEQTSYTLYLFYYPHVTQLNTFE